MESVAVTRRRALRRRRGGAAHARGGDMLFRQYQLACLSSFSYLIGDETTGRAVVVDPQRDVSQYLADAEAHGLQIERIVETHFHADFLSGHLELAAATGAVVSYGEGAEAQFPIEVVVDGQRLSLGEVVLEVLATPGHTPESISVVVHERPDAGPWAVLTGDTLFVGDVGRPDLLTSLGWTADQLARRLYRSLHDKLLALPDDTLVYPAHGAGSACGKNMSSAVVTTIGEQRRSNAALQPMSEDEFVRFVVEGQPVVPLYFAFAAGANRRTHELLDDQRRPPQLDLAAAERCQHDGGLVIDGRAPEVFAAGHLRGAVNVPLDGRFAEYAGDVAQPDQPIVLVTDPGRETEGAVRLARIGFDRVLGAITDVDAALADRPEAAATATRIAPADLATWLGQGPLQLVDVRNPGERQAGVIDGARSIPLPTLLARAGELDPAAPTVVYCASGVRSSVAASWLRQRGFARVADVIGGYDAWRRADGGVEPSAAVAPRG
jgi:glyoxylase-like metal-dependent hydrolase (beta-lactamase superfamily II)/rhodanese-related sulfurtransferase